MDDKVKNIITTVLSILALVVSGITLYTNSFSKVDIEITPAPSVYIANTIGCLPKIKTTVGVIASGSSTNNITIVNASLILKRNATKNKEEPIILVPDESTNGLSSFLSQGFASDSFPIILKGGESKPIGITFAMDNTYEKIAKIENWGNMLKMEFKDSTILEFIDAKIQSTKNAYYNISDKKVTSVAVQVSKDGFIVPNTKNDSSNGYTIEEIVKKVSGEKKSTFNYFVATDYEGELIFELSNKTTKHIAVKFRLEGPDEIKLENKYDSWLKKKL